MKKYTLLGLVATFLLTSLVLCNVTLGAVNKFQTSSAVDSFFDVFVEVETAQKSFPRTSRTSRKCGRELKKILREINKLAGAEGIDCEDQLDGKIDSLEDIINKLEENLCEEDVISRPDIRKFNCIPLEPGENLIDLIDELIDALIGALETDEDEDDIADICTGEKISDFKHNCQPFIRGMANPNFNIRCCKELSSPTTNSNESFQTTITKCENDLNCEDANPCTLDKCVENICKNEIISSCNGTSTGATCTSDDQCNDGNTCTLDKCDPGSNLCLNELISGCPDSRCMTDEDCKSNDLCVIHKCVKGLGEEVGHCSYEPIFCNDNNDCTKDTCISTTGLCENQILSGVQEVGFRTIICDNGNEISCRGDTECDDGNKCTRDKCNLGTGECQYEAIPDCNGDLSTGKPNPKDCICKLENFDENGNLLPEATDNVDACIEPN